jgi:hypothetical protein
LPFKKNKKIDSFICSNIVFLLNQCKSWSCIHDL